MQFHMLPNYRKPQLPKFIGQRISNACKIQVRFVDKETGEVISQPRKTVTFADGQNIGDTFLRDVADSISRGLALGKSLYIELDCQNVCPNDIVPALFNNN